MAYHVERAVPYGWSTDLSTGSLSYAFDRRDELVFRGQPARVVDSGGRPIVSRRDRLGFEDRSLLRRLEKQLTG